MKDIETIKFYSDHASWFIDKVKWVSDDNDITLLSSIGKVVVSSRHESMLSSLIEPDHISMEWSGQ